MPAPDLSKEEIEDLVSRFAHDVASPLMLVLALSGLLARQAGADERMAGDLKQIQAAAEEMVAMVRALGARVAPHRLDRPAGSS